MARIVQKFGGTSVATLERIKHVAEIIAKTREIADVVAVVSAMAGVTNKFVNYVYDLGGREGDPEYDFVVSSGEIVTAGLLATALKSLGVVSRSYAGWQVPIITSNRFGSAFIQSVDPSDLEMDLKKGVVPVVCGFQGIDENNRITTLGRGGSDLTAVAISDAVKAERCDIYSDVDGVYTVDPNLYAKARRLRSISYNEMLEMSAFGAKVLQEQSVAYALEKNVKVRVASTFVENDGTIICHNVTDKKFCGLAVQHNVVQVKIFHNNVEKVIQNELSSHFIRYDVLQSGDGKFSIIMDRKRLATARQILSSIEGVINIKQEMVRRHCSRISVIGRDLNNDDVNEIRSLVNASGIEVFCCSKSRYGINLVLLTEHLLKAVDILHRNCGLENE
ncbi:MAG: aspartate kinase [Alphaproteobacteria bacterium]|nr:aspartate kinase [Alphaproteobacteria bacterium]